MAKKRKDKPEEEELDFKLPKFDEEKFLKKEHRNIKTLYISFVFGLLIALISFGFWVLLADSVFRWELVLLLGVFNMSWIKYIFLKLNIDLKEFGRKGWFGSFAVYFFTWLIVLVVLVNPPFYDGESPQVDVVTLPGMQEPGGSILVVAHIYDNVGVDTQEISFSLTAPDNSTTSPSYSFEDNIFLYEEENTENQVGEFTYRLSVTDQSGLTTTVDGRFEYYNDTLKITSSRFTDIRSGDSIIIKADEDIIPVNLRVYYQLDDGDDINVNREDPDDKDEYETTAQYEGWEENTNHTMRVYAEARYYFVNVEEEFTNTIEDTTVYQFSTGDDSDIGTEPPLVEYNYSIPKNKQLSNTLNYKLPRPTGIAATPGFEFIIVVIALFAIVSLMKKKNRKKP
jgi:hypothetical protein